MWKWFSKESAPAPRSAAKPGAGSRPRAAARTLAPELGAPLPEVVSEGNTDADWSAWEDSQLALDSRLPAVDAGARVQLRDARFGAVAEQDPFARVGHRRDL
jgi:hypothetical protein